ncbi:unnamed protein product, partial [Gulo gulo]
APRRFSKSTVEIREALCQLLGLSRRLGERGEVTHLLDPTRESQRRPQILEKNDLARITKYISYCMFLSC